jgi:hypothetical protein
MKRVEVSGIKQLSQVTMHIEELKYPFSSILENNVCRYHTHIWVMMLNPVFLTP